MKQIFFHVLITLLAPFFREVLRRADDDFHLGSSDLSSLLDRYLEPYQIDIVKNAAIDFLYLPVRDSVADLADIQKGSQLLWDSIPQKGLSSEFDSSVEEVSLSPSLFRERDDV